jgi:hypothetical protein
MNDCSNANIRDQLPELVHDRLSMSARATVLAHVDGCADCREELELLRSVRGALTSNTPRVDIAYVVGALPKRYAPAAAARTPSRRWADWRVAAAVTLLVAGGSSVAVLTRAPAGNTVAAVDSALPGKEPVTIDSAVAASTAPLANSKLAPRTTVPSTTVASADEQEARTDVGPDGRLAGLTDAQLKALLGDIDRLEPVPLTEPEPVTIKVNPNGSSLSPEKMP